MKFSEFMGKTKKYKNIKDEEIKNQTLEEIKCFIEDQKKIILALDKDIEHIYIYNSQEWKELEQLSLESIIDNTREYEEKLKALKLKTLDRNFPNVYNATRTKEMIEICLQIKRMEDVDEERSTLATIEQHNSGGNGKVFGIIDKEEWENIKSIVEFRKRVAQFTSIEDTPRYVEQLKDMERKFEYEKFIRLLNKTRRYIENMQANQLRFSQKCETQIKQILGQNASENFKCQELQLSLYMMIFAQYFDDKNPLEVSDEDIERIMKKVWVEQEPNDIKNEVGTIYMSKKQYIQFCDIYTSEDDREEGKILLVKSETKWILNQIRNAIMHGSFEIFEKDGATLINVFGEEFKSTFKFDCLIDICEELFETSKDKQVPIELETLLKALKTSDIQNARKVLNENPLDLFDLYINSIFSYNEDMFHKKKKVMFEGMPEIKEGMKSDAQMGHIRNSIVHRYRKLSGDEIIVKDGKIPESLEEITRVNIGNFLRFVREVPFVENVMNNLESQTAEVEI